MIAAVALPDLRATHPAGGAAREALAAEIRDVLFSAQPETAVLEERLARRYGLTSAQARSLIYQVTLHLNRHLFPPVTQLELIHTEGCNLACTYCFEKDMLGVRRMTPDILTAALDLFFDYAGESPELRITHFGGEPTLNFPAIRAATEYAEQKAAARGQAIRFDLTSNGVHLTDEMAEYFARHRIWVLLSVDGLAAAHDRFRRDRGGRGTFARVMRTLERLRRTQGWVGVKMTVMPENAARLLPDVQGLHALGVNQFVIGHATGVRWPVEAMQAYSEQLAAVFRWYTASPRDALRIAEFEQSAADTPYFGCQAARTSITAAVTGEISPCAKVLALDNRTLLAKLGDVHHGLTHLRTRAELVSCTALRTACERQGIAEAFHGGCFATNYTDSGDLFVPSAQEHAFSLVRRTACGGCAAQGGAAAR
jgi:uncharacterized protein